MNAIGSYSKKREIIPGDNWTFKTEGEHSW